MLRDFNICSIDIIVVVWRSCQSKGSDCIVVGAIGKFCWYYKAIGFGWKSWQVNALFVFIFSNGYYEQLIIKMFLKSSFRTLVTLAFEMHKFATRAGLLVPKDSNGKCSIEELNLISICSLVLRVFWINFEQSGFNFVEYLLEHFEFSSSLISNLGRRSESMESTKIFENLCRHWWVYFLKISEPLSDFLL